MATSRPPIRVVFQGVPGAYSDAAARELLNANQESTRIAVNGLPSFEACFRAVSEGEAEYACLPMENTMGGSVSDNFDLQLKNSLSSVAEIHFAVRHCLLALPGQSKRDIKVVISHWQALSQCAEYLRRELPWAEVRTESDTAGSALMIAEKKLNGYAAVASTRAADVYGLQRLDEDIQDAKDNYTRFLLYAREPVDASRAMQAGFKVKASIVFSIGNRAGALYHAIEPLAKHKLNMTKLESRPDRRRGENSLVQTRDGGALNLIFGCDFLANLPYDDAEDTGAIGENGELEFKAMFFLDFVVSAGAREAMRELAAMSPFFRVLGVYAADGLLIGTVADGLGCVEGTNFTRGKKRGSSPGTTPSPPVVSESKRARPAESLTIAVLGFGNFGQFLAKQMHAMGHRIVAWSRNHSQYSAVAKDLNVELFNDANDMLHRTSPDVVVLSMSILSFEDCVKMLNKDLLKNTLVVDVLSVKAFAKRVLLAALPEQADIVCTHPMFGPESGKHTWRNLPFVFERVRVRDVPRSDALLGVFSQSGCTMIEMTCEEHDAKAANSQFVTHFTGRALGELRLSRTGIDTKGFLSLLDLVDNTCKDSDDLFVALYQHNANAANTLDAVRLAVDGVAFRLKSAGASKDVSIALSECVGRVAPSKTVKTHGLAMELKAAGKDVVTTLTVGEPNFGPPEEAIIAGQNALRDPKGTKYTAVSGTIELRKAIASDYAKRKGVTYDPAKEILVSGGGKQSVYQAVHALCGPGDEVVIPAPFWVSYPDICRLAGAKPIIVQRDPAIGYILRADQLERAITKRTRMFILCNPCNPTGCMYSRDELMALVEVLNKHPRIIILADEIYERIVFPDAGQHVSFAALPGMRNRTLIVNGVAKGFAMTGMRIGWLCGPEIIVKACEKLQSQISSSACSVSQAASAAVLHLDPSVAGPGPENLAMLLRNRDVGFQLLSAIPGVRTVKGGGAFYFFVSLDPSSRPKGLNCEKLCEYLIKREKGVAMVPGDAFGDTPESCSFRISYACSEADLREGIARFAEGLNELRAAAQ